MLTTGHDTVAVAAPAVEMVTVLEAASRLGTHVETVRRRLRSGELTGERRPLPRGGWQWFVSMPVEVPSAASPRVAAIPVPISQLLQPATQPATDAGAVATLAATVEALRDRLEDARGEVARLDALLVERGREIEALHGIVATLVAKPPARTWWRWW